MSYPINPTNETNEIVNRLNHRLKMSKGCEQFMIQLNKPSPMDAESIRIFYMIQLLKKDDDDVIEVANV
jgi:hypothetical protein